MKPEVRAIVAYVAGELIVRKGFTSIYDYSNGQSHRYEAHFGEYDVDVTDMGSKAQLAGGAFGKHYSLYHYGDQSRIELNIAGKSFDGEHSRGARFKGFLKDNLVTLIEGENQFVYGLM
jgi:hypothetical protein